MSDAWDEPEQDTSFWRTFDDGSPEFQRSWTEARDRRMARRKRWDVRIRRLYWRLRG